MTTDRATAEPSALRATSGRASGESTRAGLRATLLESRIARFALQALTVLAIFAIWELMTATEVVSPLDVPSPVDVIKKLVEEVQTAAFWEAVGQTFLGAGIGFAIAVAVGAPLGMLIGSSTALWRALRPTIEFLRPVPGVALIPLVILLWGQTMTSDIALVAIGTVWLVLIQAIYGARAVDDTATQTARAFGLGPVARFRWVTLPSALPYLATGLRLASAGALIVAITAELVIGVPGLGSTLRFAQQGAQVDLVYALVLASGLLGIAVHVVFTRMERHFLRWHPSQRQGLEL